MKYRDVRVGSATVPAHEGGGWALPGGGVTMIEQEAEQVAQLLSVDIDRGREIAEERERLRQARAGRSEVTVTRVPAKNYRRQFGIV